MDSTLLVRRVPQVVLVAVLAVFGLAAWGSAAAGDSGTVTATVTVAAAQLTVDLDARPNQIRAGQQTQLRARVRNEGPASVGPVAVELALVPAFRITDGTNPATVPQIRPRRHEDVRWRVCASVSGSYLLTATATVNGVNGPVSFTSNTELVEVRAPNRGGRC
ncbi:MAG: CARDB domain-containing protein [Dehalococcoidia bacterium]